MEAGFDVALTPGQGKYSAKTARYKEVLRARERILEALPPDLHWTEVRPRHYRLIWRTFIERRRTWKQNWRMSEIAVSAVAAIGAWLLDEDYVDAFRPPKRGWRAELRLDWQQATKKPCKPARPRHTDSEMDRFWGGLDRAGIDPRLRLGAELGAELRIGQVLRCDRSDLDLTPGAGGGHGVLEVHGEGRKPGATVYLTARQRSVVDAAFCNRTGGHMALYERALQAGELDDFPLFPPGELIDGQLRLPASGQPAGRMARRNMLKLFTTYERSVGIKHVRGRAWYGIRRRSSDRIRRVSTDERVRDAAGGWTPGSSTRERVYMDGTDPDVLSETASARERARGRTEQELPGADPRDLEAVLRSMGLPEEKVRALLVIAAPASRP